MKSCTSGDMVSLATNTNPGAPFPICLKTDQRNWLLGVHRDLRTHNCYRLSCGKCP